MLRPYSHKTSEYGIPYLINTMFRLDDFWVQNTYQYNVLESFMNESSDHHILGYGLLEWKQICIVFYICIAIGDPDIKRGGLKSHWPVWPCHICACPMSEPGFLTSRVRIFFMFNELRWEEIVHFHFVGIERTVEHHCLNFLFIICEKGYHEHTDAMQFSLVSFSFKQGHHRITEILLKVT